MDKYKIVSIFRSALPDNKSFDKLIFKASLEAEYCLSIFLASQRLPAVVQPDNKPTANKIITFFILQTINCVCELPDFIKPKKVNFKEMKVYRINTKDTND